MRFTKHTVYEAAQSVRIKLIIAVVHCKAVIARARGAKLLFLLGTPEHNNIGDLAITRAELQFIKQYLPATYTITVPFSVLERDITFLQGIITDSDIIAGHGGGNMGDIYVPEEVLRRNIVTTFSDNKIIVFPQTMHFSTTKKGRRELQKTQKAYSRHKDLTLIARENDSFALMASSFSHNTVLVTPDIVLSLNKSSSTKKRKGALSCIRDDRESRLSATQKTKITAALHDRYSSVRHTDTLEPKWLARLMPHRLTVHKKLRQFKKAEIVITDRLHGMVFAAITGTPCIALTNFNHKVKGTFNWIKGLRYVHFIDSIEQLEEALELIDSSRTYRYDPSMFDTHWRKITNAFEY